MVSTKQRLKRLKLSIYDAHAHTWMSSYMGTLSRFSRYFVTATHLTRGFLSD